MLLTYRFHFGDPALLGSDEKSNGWVRRIVWWVNFLKDLIGIEGQSKIYPGFPTFRHSSLSSWPFTTAMPSYPPGTLRLIWNFIPIGVFLQDGGFLTDSPTALLSLLQGSRLSSSTWVSIIQDQNFEFECVLGTHVRMLRRLAARALVNHFRLAARAHVHVHLTRSLSTSRSGTTCGFDFLKWLEDLIIVNNSNYNYLKSDMGAF